MILPNGYRTESTFDMDFTIADVFGESAIRDTFNRAFTEWKDNYKYLTELVIILNLKIWEWYKKDNAIAIVYDELWRKADAYAYENLNGDEFAWFYKITN